MPGSSMAQGYYAWQLQHRQLLVLLQHAADGTLERPQTVLSIAAAGFVVKPI
jgi:hypothetical protein